MDDLWLNPTTGINMQSEEAERRLHDNVFAKDTVEWGRKFYGCYVISEYGHLLTKARTWT